MIFTYDQAIARDEFEENHNPHVCIEGMMLFIDGARKTSTDCIEPPEDAYELAKLQLQYWTIVADERQEAFEEYKAFLEGHGRSDVVLYTDEDKLNYLKGLIRKANRAIKRAQQARRDVEATTPEWLQESDEADTDESSRQAAFKADLDRINL